jgi:hypothetical protein
MWQRGWQKEMDKLEEGRSDRNPLTLAEAAIGAVITNSIQPGLGCSTISENAIASMARCDVRTVRRAIKVLEKNGPKKAWFHVQRFRRQNHYYPLFDEGKGKAKDR